MSEYQIRFAALINTPTLWHRIGNGHFVGFAIAEKFITDLTTTVFKPGNGR